MTSSCSDFEHFSCPVVVLYKTADQVLRNRLVDVQMCSRSLPASSQALGTGGLKTGVSVWHSSREMLESQAASDWGKRSLLWWGNCQNSCFISVSYGSLEVNNTLIKGWRKHVSTQSFSAALYHIKIDQNYCLGLSSTDIHLEHHLCKLLMSRLHTLCFIAQFCCLPM